MTTLPAGWKPIESAPKDGTDILLTNGVHVSCGHWHYDEGGTTEHRDLDGRYIGQDDRDGFAGWLDWMGGMTPNPTHWMPLPAAPGSTSSAQGDAQDKAALLALADRIESASERPIHISIEAARLIREAVSGAPAAGNALSTIKGAAITGGYVVVTPAGWGEDKAQKVRDAILRLFPVDPAYRPKPETDIAAQQGNGGEA